MKRKHFILALMAMLMSFSVSLSAQTTVTTAEELKSALTAGGEVTLGGDIEVTSQLEIPAEITATLDLNGNAITSTLQSGSDSKHIYPLSNNGTFTIKDSKGTGSITGRGIYNQSGATITVDGAKIIAEDWNGGAGIWCYGSESKVYLNNATIIGNTGVVSSEGYLEINGGIYTCHSGIMDDGTQNTPTYNIRAYNGLKITDGTFTSRHGVISVGGGEAVIEDGSYTILFTAATTSNVVYVYQNAVMTINGGNFTSDNTSGKADSGAAVLVSGSDATLTINDGTFVGMNGMVSINEKTVINGGSFSTVWDYNHYDNIESAVATGAIVTVAGKTYTKTESGLEEVVEVATYDELVAALAKGGKIKLTADITTTSAIVTSGVTSTIDLNSKTLTIGAGDNKFNDKSNVTIENGTISITGVTVGGNAIFCLDEYETSLATTLTLNKVNLVGDGYSSAYGVFYIGKSSVLNVNGGVWNLANDTHASGGVFKADASTATLNIDGLQLTAHNVRRGVTYATTTIENSTIAFSGDADEVDTEMEHGFNRSPLAISNSTITMTDMVGRGITAECGAVTISENSTVTMTNCQEATIDVRNNQTVTISNNSTVTLDAEPTITNGTISGTVNVQSPAVAQIGDTKYATLAEAIAAAQAGETITLLADATIANPLTIKTSLTIDGNGKTLTYTGSTRAIDIATATETIDEVSIKNLTINCTASNCQRGINFNGNDSNETNNDCGTINLDGVTVAGTNITYAFNLQAKSDGVKVNINNSSLTGNIALNVWGENATIKATDSHFTSVDKAEAENYAAVKLNNDGTNAAEGTTITITGGSITALDENSEPSTAVSNGTETGKVQVSETTKVTGNVKEIVAAVRYEGNTNSYGCYTLQAAINRAAESTTATVKLLKDVTVSEQLTINDAVVIDLNGKKVTANCKKAFEVYANATIKNGTIEAQQRCVDTRKAVELTLEGVNLIADNYYAAHGNPQPLTIGGAEHGTKVTMTSSTISAKAGYGIISFVKTEATITESTISGYNAYYAKSGSEGSVINFVKSTLTGDNTSSDVEDNSFSVIALQCDNVTVNVDAESAVHSKGNYMSAVSIGYVGQPNNTGNKVTIAGTINAVNAEGTATGNILSTAVASQNTVSVKSEYANALAEAGYATSEANTDGMVTVMANTQVDEMTIVDGELDKFVNNYETKVGKLTYERTFSNLTWNALYVPFEIPMSELIAGYDVAYINNYHCYDDNEDGTIDRMTMEVIKITEETSSLNANHPYLIRPKTEDDKELRLELTEATLYAAKENSVTAQSTTTDFVVTGTYSRRQVDDLTGSLVMGVSSTTGTATWLTMSQGTLNPFRLILTITPRPDVSSVVKFSAEATKAIRIHTRGESDETTDIESLDSEQTSNVIYDLQGRRVLEPQKGSLYIVNGKKVVF